MAWGSAVPEGLRDERVPGAVEVGVMPGEEHAQGVAATRDIFRVQGLVDVCDEVQEEP